MPVERGNPNVFTVFKGRFECEVDPEATTTNATIMLTCVNDVQFLGNFTPGASGLLGTLPAGCRPPATVFIPCIVGSVGAMANGILIVEPDGTMVCEASKTVYLQGVSFNISSCWYN
jgi:hypothetical protein